ncbi:hypothetical protein ACFX13_039133 [Malus domestica]
MHHRQPLELLHLHHDIVRRRDSLRVREHLVIVHVPQDPDVPPSLHANGFEDLVIDKMADAGLGHDGDGDRKIDFLDKLGVGHSGNAAPGSDVDRMCLRAMTA